MKGLVDMPPEEVYTAFVNPNNAGVFRSIDSVEKHEVIEETAEHKLVYVEQAATVGALWFKKQFTTALDVTHRPNKLSTSFTLARPGMMSAFRGHWSLEAVDQETYAQLTADRVASSLSHPPGQPRPGPKCLMHLEQDVMPAIAQKVPPIFHGMLRRICMAAVGSLVQDIHTIAALRQRGVPLQVILTRRVHGRGGLKATYLDGKNPAKWVDEAGEATATEEALPGLLQPGAVQVMPVATVAEVDGAMQSFAIADTGDMLSDDGRDVDARDVVRAS